MSRKNKAIPNVPRVPIALSADLEKRIRDFILSLKNVQETGTSKLSASDIFFGNEQEGLLFLSGDDSRNYRENLKALRLEVCKSELISSDAVGKMLNAAILETLDINSQRMDQSFEQRLEQALAKLKAALSNGFQNYRVYYPIVGLASDGLPFTFGNLELGIFQEQYLDEIGLLPEKQTDQKKKEFAEMELKNLHDNGLWGKPYAKLTIGAHDAKTARRNAIREIRACLEILNFYSDLISTSVTGFLYLPGEANSTMIISPVIADGASYPSILYERVGPFIDLSLQALLKAEADKGLGLTRVLQLVSAKRNEYEERLLTAIRWAGKATVLAHQARNEDAFLLYMIALEAIITPEMASEITYRLSLRLAHLMASEAKHRSGIAKQVRDLYGIRCAIVHSGSFEVTDSDLALARFVIKSCLVHILRDEPFSKMNSVDDLLKWFDTKIFGEP